MSIEHEHLTLAKQGQSFSALVSVVTPIDDDSGVAHGVEHLVFRRNAMSQEPSSLYQLTSLLPLEINATTRLGVTHYHCHSTSAQACLLGLNYLLESITNLVIKQQDLKCELGNSQGTGVIFLELGAQQQTIRLAGTSFSLEQLLQSDNSCERLMLLGGTQQHISTLRLHDLQQYYDHHYCAGNIKVTTTSNHAASEFIKKVQALCLSTVLNEKPVLPIAKPVTHSNPTISVDTLPTNEVFEICWWLDTSIKGYSAAVRHIKENVTDNDILVVSAASYPNYNGHWPLRILVATDLQRIDIAAIEALIIATLERQKPRHQGDLCANHKQFPDGVRKSISRYHQQHGPKSGKEHALVKCNTRRLPFTSMADGEKSEKSVASKQSVAPNAASAKLISSLRTFSYQIPTDVETSANLQHNENTIRVASNGNLDLRLLLREITNLLGVDGSISDDQIVIELSVEEINRLKQTIETVMAKVGSYSAQLPKILWPLRPRGNKSQATVAYNESKTGLVIANQIEQTFSADAPSSFAYGNDQHRVTEFKITAKSTSAAWCLSLILGAYAPYLQRRLIGHCYTVSARFCPYHRRLMLFTAYDRSVDDFTAHVQNSLAQLMGEQEFLFQTLSLARLKIRGILHESNAKVSPLLDAVSVEQIKGLVTELLSAMSKNNNNKMDSI